MNVKSKQLEKIDNKNNCIILLTTPKIVGLCGILSPIIGFIFISIAIQSAPWFSWTENWISDLGGFEGDRPIYSAKGTESILLNISKNPATLIDV